MIDVTGLEHLRPQAEDWGLSLEAAVLGARFLGAVRRYELPVPGRKDERNLWIELRRRALDWCTSDDGQEVAKHTHQVWVRLCEELTPKYRDLLARKHPADLVNLLGKQPRLTRTHVWTSPELGFPETHGLLLFLWTFVLGTGMPREAITYYCDALFGQLVQARVLDAVVADELIVGMEVYSEANLSAQNDGYGMIQRELMKVGRTLKPHHLPQDEFDEARLGITDEFLAKELPKLNDLDIFGVFEHGLRRHTEIRHEFKRDVLNLLETPISRHQRYARRDKTTDAFANLDRPQWCRDWKAWEIDGQEIEYRDAARALEAHAKEVNAVYGTRATQVILMRLSDPDITDEAIAELLDCHVRTIGRVNEKIGANQEPLRRLLGFLEGPIQ